MFTNLVVVRCIVVIKVIKHMSRLVLCHLINMSQNVRAVESEAELHAFVFKHEFTMVVAGPSRSGKTEFVKALVRHKDRVIHPPPTKVVWCYREWQKAYEDIRDVKFVKEIPQDDEVLVSDTSERHLLVFDDMMGSGDAIVDWFTRKAHHRNTSVVYITQNVFDRGAHHRTISLNSHYMVLFKNPRDKSQVDVLSRQLKLPCMNYAYQDATGRPHGYLVVDMTPTTPDHLRLRTDVFHTTGEGGIVVYMPKV